MSLRKTGWNHYSKQGLLSAICENNTNRKTYLSVEYGDAIKSLETCSNWVGIMCEIAVKQFRGSYFGARGSFFYRLLTCAAL